MAQTNTHDDFSWILYGPRAEQPKPTCDCHEQSLGLARGYQQTCMACRIPPTIDPTLGPTFAQAMELTPIHWRTVNGRVYRVNEDRSVELLIDVEDDGPMSPFTRAQCIRKTDTGRDVTYYRRNGDGLYRCDGRQFSDGWDAEGYS